MLAAASGSAPQTRNVLARKLVIPVSIRALALTVLCKQVALQVHIAAIKLRAMEVLVGRVHPWLVAME